MPQHPEKLPSLDHLPLPIRPILQIIENNALNEVGAALSQYVASFSHPDFVCNLAMMPALPPEAKKAAADMFDYCLRTGLTLEEQGALYQIIEPFVMASILNSPRH